MASKDDVKVGIGGDNKPLKGALDQSRQMIAQFSRLGSGALSPFTRSLTGMVGNIFSVRGAIATLAGTGGLGLLISRSIETADQIGKTADRIGLGIEAYQELKFAAGEAGVGVDLFNTAMTALVRRQGEAIGGNKGFAQAFTNLGISVQELRSLRPEDLLGRVADGVNNLGSQAEKLAALDRVMSEAGRRLVNFTDLGSEGLARVRQEAREMGLVLDAVMVRQAEAAGDQLARVGNILSTNVTRALLGATPTIVAFGRAFAEAAPHIAGFFSFFLSESLAPVEELEKRLLQARHAALAMEVAGGQPGFMDTRIRELEALLEARRVAEAAIFEDAGAGSGGDAAAGGIEKIVEALRFEQEQLGRTARGQEIYNIFRKSSVALNAESVAAVSPYLDALEESRRLVEENKAAEKSRAAIMREGAIVIEQARTPLEAYQAEIERLNGLLDYGAIAQDTYNRAVLVAQKAFDEAANKTDLLRIAQEELGDIIRDTGNAVLQGSIKGWRDWAQVAVNAIGRVFAAWVEMQQAQAGGSGGGWLSGLISGVGSIFSLFTGAASGIGAGNTTGFGGPRAAGGPVMPGMVYPVGEHGPELFAPAAPGTILSAPASRGLLAGAGGGMVVNQTFINPTRDSIPEIIAAVRALGVTVRQVDASIERRAIGAVTNARGRDPELFGGVA